MRFAWVILFLPLAVAQDRTELRQRAEQTAAEAERIASASINANSDEGFPAAIAKLESAAEFYRELDDRAARCKIFLRIGRLYFLALEYPAALEADEHGLALASKAGDEKLQIRALIQAGLDHQLCGDHQTEMEYLNRARALARQSGDINAQVQVLLSTANSYLRLGDTRRAVDLFYDRLALVRKGGDRADEMEALRGVAHSLAVSGDYKQSIAVYSQAAEIANELRDYNQQKRFFNQMGQLNLKFGHYAEALENFERPVPIQELSHMKSIDLLLESEALAKLGETERARERVRRAMEPISQFPEIWAFAIYQRAAPIYRTLGQPAEALECYRRALERNQRSGSWEGEAVVRAGMARAHLDVGDVAAARQHIELAISLTESVRAKVMSPELRATYLATFQDLRQFYVELLMSTGAKAAAFEANERGRARSLLEYLAQDRIDAGRVDPTLLKRRREVGAALNAAYLSGRPQTDKIQRLTAEHDSLEASLRAQNGDYAALTLPAILSVPEVQSLLDDRTLLIEYSLGDSKSFAWAIGKESSTSVELPSRLAVEAVARQTYDALRARNRHPAGETPAARNSRVAKADADFTIDAQRLGRMILAPLDAQIRTKDRILVVADGALQYIPFAALPFETDAALIERHEVVGLPSASVVPLLGGRHRPASNTVALFADPVFDPTDERVRGRGTSGARSLPYDLERSASGAGLLNGGRIPRLPFSRKEAERIAEIGGSANVWKRLDFSASKAALSRPEITRYGTLHIATHGIFDSEHPTLSGIVLSLIDRDGHAQDGFLRLQDIFNLRLNARTVVLSACETALGKEIRGEGLVGVTRGFLYAGASTVVSSLWRVDDAATADLMPAFYRSLLRKGLPSGAALRSAQLEVRKQDRFRAPYYWAGFLLQGDWK